MKTVCLGIFPNRYRAYKNDSMVINNSPADTLYSRLATLSALQSYAATAGYYMTNVQQLHAAQASAVVTSFHQQVAAFHEQNRQVRLKINYCIIFLPRDTFWDLYYGM